jgi:methyl-accepting chemotaxis protein
MKKISYYRGINGQPVAGTYIPISELGWAVVVELPVNEANREVITSIFISLALLFILAVISAISGILLAKRLTAPLQQLTAMIVNISKGEGDLTRKLNIITHDEIGILSKNFNIFIDSLKTIITEIISVSEKTKSISENLTSITEENNACTNIIFDNLNIINGKINVLSAEITSIDHLVDNFQSFMNRLGTIIDKQTGFINHSSSGFEEIAQSIQNVVEVTEKKTETVQQLADLATIGKNEMDETIGIINKMTESTNSILEIVSVIDNISSQTNLLAMNASIEAAQAGVYGKGFTVVADEIKRLADDTAANAKEIIVKLKEIINAIHISESHAGKTGEYFGEITINIKEVLSSMLEMKSSMNELSGSGQKIKSSLAAMNGTTFEVGCASMEINKKLSDISSSVKKVVESSSETKTSIALITEGLREVTDSSKRLLKSDNELSENIASLYALVHKFKT